MQSYTTPKKLVELIIDLYPTKKEILLFEPFFDGEENCEIRDDGYCWNKNE